MFMFADMDNYLSTKGYGNGLSIDGDLDLDKLEYLYQGLKDRGLSDSEALNVIQRMKSESNLDAYSESEEGDGLMPELGYRNNMFSEDEDTEIDRQLNAVVRSIRNGKIKADTISGALDSEITRGLGFNNFSEGGDIETADNGTESEFAWYPSDSILNYIKKVEGYRPYWYKDGNGVMTIGYGFTDTGLMKTHPKWMSRKDADNRFKEEIDSRISSFISATPNFDKLTDSQRDALFDYYYNIGHGNYTKGSPGMQAALAAGDLYAVRDSIDIGYNDKNNAGLRQRRDYERSLFGLEPVYESSAPVGRRKINYDMPVWDSKTALWATKQNMSGRTMNNKFESGGDIGNYYGGGSGIKRVAKRILSAITDNGREARDARIGAVGAQQVRDLYYEDEDAADKLAKDYLKANLTGLVTGTLSGNTVGHVLKVLANPASASTEAGAISSVVTDASGLVGGIHELGKDADKAIAGQYGLRDVPKTLLDATVLVPGTSLMTNPAIFDNMKLTGTVLKSIPEITSNGTVVNRIVHPVETYRFADLMRRTDGVLPDEMYSELLKDLKRTKFHNAPINRNGYTFFNRKPADEQLGILHGKNKYTGEYLEPEVFGLGDRTATNDFSRAHEIGHIVDDAAEKTGYVSGNYPPWGYRYNNQSVMINPDLVVPEFNADVFANGITSDMSYDSASEIRNMRYPYVRDYFPVYRKK